MILPVRNRRAFLEESLASAVARTGPDDEIVVVDDGSSDGTSEDLRAPADRVRVLRTEGVGPSRARNRGIAAARGRFVAFLDSDDAWLPAGLDEQVAALQSEAGHGLSHARAEPVDAVGQPLERLRKPPLAGPALRHLLRRNPVTTSTVVVPRAVLDEVGGFDEDLARSMDRDLWIRIAERRPFHWLDVTVARYRFHAEQLIRSRRAVDEARCRIYEKAIARYEAAGRGPVRLARRLLAYRRLRLGRMCLAEGDGSAAEECFAAAIRLRPLARLAAWRYRRRR